MDKNTRIQVKNVSKTFSFKKDRQNTIKSFFHNPFADNPENHFEALKDISFDVKDGEFLGIIGRNGSGKSTLLKILAGIYESDQGQVTVRGTIVPFLELGVGFNMDLNAIENIYLNGTILGLSNKVIDQKVEDMIEFAELTDFKSLALKNYSSGMTVRLAFSIAINVPADIYLIDEVLAVGDINFRKKSLNVFKQFKKNKKTIIFVSHELESIKDFCDRVILVENHKIHDIGSPEEMIKKYKELM